MARHALTLNSKATVAKARQWLERAIQLKWRVEFKEPKRSDAQNDRFWEILGRVSKRMDLNGNRFAPEQWKVIFMEANGHKPDFLPSLSGGFFPTGFRSSDLGIREMADLQTFIEAWCAERGMDIWSDEQ